MRRTHQPIRKHSRLAGRCEAFFWQRTDRQQVRRIVLAAERYELAGKEGGHRNGPLGHVALEVLRLLANVVDFRTGRLDPSLDYLQAKLKRSRDAIHRALRALRAHGFLDWLRRYVPTGNPTGVQVQQTSNAYRLSLPNRALKLLGRMAKAAPLPDDFSHAKAEHAATVQRQLDGLSVIERTALEASGSGLEAVLLRMARSVMEKQISVGTPTALNPNLGFNK